MFFKRIGSLAIRSNSGITKIRNFASSSTAIPTSTEAQVVDTENVQKKVFESIRGEINDSRQRLFAIVYVNGRQWKVSGGDLISLEGNLPLNVGDEIKLEKVLMVGGSNFSLFGRPLLDSNSAEVEAVVVEKSTKSPELEYVHLNHHQTKIIKWRSDETTVLRIKQVIAKKLE